MPRKENQPRHQASSEPSNPSPLSPELAEFFSDKRYACVTTGTDQGTIFVVKAPSSSIDSVRGSLAIHIRHELYELPSAPVIRMAVRLYDQPQRPLVLETFINVGDPQQRTDYEALAGQRRAYILFYDEDHRHRLSKQVATEGGGALRRILRQAVRMQEEIPTDRFDFDRAKAVVMDTTGL